MVKLYLKNGETISLSLSSREIEKSLVYNFNQGDDVSKDILEMELKNIAIGDIEKIVFSSTKMPAVVSLTPLILSVFSSSEVSNSSEPIAVDRLLEGLRMTTELF